jgi:hypothetical protein
VCQPNTLVCMCPSKREFAEPITVAEFMRQKYVSKESANGLNTMQVGGVGFPTENLKDRPNSG